MAETDDEWIGETGQAIRVKGFLEFGGCSNRSAQDYDAQLGGPLKTTMIKTEVTPKCGHMQLRKRKI